MNPFDQCKSRNDTYPTISDTIKNYKLVKFLGEGAYGCVYKVEDTKDIGKTYALKIINKLIMDDDKNILDRFQLEIKYMKLINNDNVIKVFDNWNDGNNYYMIINYCDNGDLEMHLREKGRFQENDAIYYLKQISCGIKAYLKYNIIHRDLKVENIFVHKDTAIVGDFGLLKAESTQAKSICGSEMYMAPELLKHKYSRNRDINFCYDNKVDMFSLGLMFYEMLYGSSSFELSFDIFAYGPNERWKASYEHTGQNLKFLPKIKVSDLAKALLKAMTEPDPIKRIDWKDFFMHKLFSEQSVEKHDNFEKFTSSEINRINQKKVDANWTVNVDADDLANIFGQMTPITPQFQTPVEQQGDPKK